MFGLFALLLSGITLLIAWAIAQNVNRIQAQLDQWEREVDAQLKELSNQLISNGATSGYPTWTAEIRHKGGKFELIRIEAPTEGGAMQQLLRQGIDPSRIRTLTRG